MILAIAYALTILAVIFPITTIPTAIIGGLIGRLLRIYLIAMLVGSLLVWSLINQLWQLYAEGPVPVLAFLLCFIILSTTSFTRRHNLNPAAKNMIGAEQWAIVLLCGYNIITSDEIRWY